MDDNITHLICEAKHRATIARRENVRDFVVQSGVSLPSYQVSSYFTPDKVENIRKRSFSGYHMSGIHVSRCPRETSDPWAERAAEGAFLSYFGPFSLPYIVYRNARDWYEDRFKNQTYISLRFMSPSHIDKRSKKQQQDIFLTGNPQILPSSLKSHDRTRSHSLCRKTSL